jgi:hypothetical protein
MALPAAQDAFPGPSAPGPVSEYPPARGRKTEPNAPWSGVGHATQMKTRLMVLIPPEPITREPIEAKCGEMRRLQAEGKLQNLPPVCARLPHRPKASRTERSRVPA